MDTTAGLDGVLFEDEDLDSVLQQVVVATLGAIPGVDAASVTLLRDGRGATAACSHQAALELDLCQYELDAGPCLSAARTGTWVVVECAEDEGRRRWPRFCEDAVAAGVHAFMAAPLEVRGRTVGALNLYGREPGAFLSTDRRDVELFARRAAVLLANAEVYDRAVRQGENLREALASRAVIEQAKGILMAQLQVDADGAFETLRAMSQRGNRKLRQVAEQVVSSVAPAG